MGKAKNAKLRNYRKVWEKCSWAQGWLCEADRNDNNVNEAFCKICKSFLRAHQTDLKKHSNGKTHTAKMKMIVSEPIQSRIEVEKCTADLIYEHICKYIEHIGLNLINLVGIGTDGATADVFPSHIDFICREVFNWFHISPLRRAEYKNAFEYLTYTNGKNKKFHQFYQLSGTRWLARSYVQKKIMKMTLTSSDIKNIRQNISYESAYLPVDKCNFDKRLPDNLKLFQELQYFSPKQCLNQLHPKFSNLLFIHKFLEQSMFSSLE
ncbi:Zinc finger protein, partial [Aphis craccivora]